MNSQENKLALHTAAQRKNNTFLIENFKQLHKKMDTFRQVLTQQPDRWGNTVLHYLVISECVEAAQFLYDLMSHQNFETRKKYAKLIQRKDLYTKCQHFEYAYQVVEMQLCVYAFPSARRAMYMQRHQAECRVKEMIEVCVCVCVCV
ncbi:hypothetical protein RFI_20030 [Reticulomyxa filosa]|uniref:Uncharacterized protein n=1 Tax=Reticulomyxa filosa TaxID=46433 RepID=X6MW15_RETFI|nr:hypothetical protein RFI_20030 [Reticulomyxa filosa]|eukprot:ETO17295.1 hypothetical protein RFI_20030 [Reticulomyxa filosa]